MESELQNGVRLRIAKPEDIENLAAFNGRIHEEPGEEGKIVAWTTDLMKGPHPTTNLEDFLIVETEEGEIVSSTCIVPQVWLYEDIEIKVGRPELVGTDENWRKKGLVREQFKVLHEMSAKNGDLMQVITGIPWYYRMFGYTHAVDLGGSRLYDWNRPGNLAKIAVEDEKFEWRKATVDDIPFLMTFYAQHCKDYLLNTQRTAEQWAYELSGRSENSIYNKEFWLISKKDGTPVGYLGYVIWPVGITINELGCDASQSMREFGLYVTRAIYRHISKVIEDKKAAGEEPNINKRLILYFGQDHAIYRALGNQTGKQTNSYAWFIRIPDIPAFLKQIQPVLERRLANSVMVGHSGAFKINLYEEKLELVFEDGKISEMRPYETKIMQGGDMVCTRPEFVQLICGHRSFQELNHMRVDCNGNAEAFVLMDILFPKIPSHPLGIT